MGSGGYAARPLAAAAAAAAERLAQRRQVEKAAFSTDYGAELCHSAALCLCMSLSAAVDV